MCRNVKSGKCGKIMLRIFLIMSIAAVVAAIICMMAKKCCKKKKHCHALEEAGDDCLCGCSQPQGCDDSE